MKKILALLQFFPLTAFLIIARSYDFTNQGWSIAFQWAALMAVIQLMILLPLLKNKMSRLVAGVNLFFIFGGIAFFFKNEILLNFMEYLKEAGIIFFVAVVCIAATIFSRTGVFETAISKSHSEKKYSVYYLLATAFALIWAFAHRGDMISASAGPFILLNILKEVFERKLSTI
ncbi:MAG: hypothetical protein AB7F59_06265 [Bdellovibrionales bacterium]